MARNSSLTFKATAVPESLTPSVNDPICIVLRFVAVSLLIKLAILFATVLAPKVLSHVVAVAP